MLQPKLRFPEFNDEWKEYRLKDIVDRLMRKNKNNETDLPLTISSIEGLIDQRTYFNKVVASKDMSGYYLLKKGEFAYNKSYSVGYDYGSIKRLDRYEMGALSTLYICFSLKDNEQNIRSDFLTKYFDSQKWYRHIYINCAEGARNHGLLNIPVEDFFEMKVVLPSIKEQEKICSLILKIEEKIKQQEEIVDNFEKFKTGISLKIFNQEIRFKNSKGDNFPECSKKQMKEIAEFRQGFQIPASQQISNEKEGYLRYLYISDFLNDKNALYVKNCESFYHIREKDICVANTGATCGKAFRGKEGILSNNMFKIFFSPEINEDYAWQFFNSPAYLKQLETFTNGAGQPHIGHKNMGSMSILVPSIVEQKVIADFLFKLDQKLNAEKAILEDWKQMKKALLQQMFV